MNLEKDFRNTRNEIIQECMAIKEQKEYTYKEKEVCDVTVTNNSRNKPGQKRKPTTMIRNNTE